MCRDECTCPGAPKCGGGVEGSQHPLHFGGGGRLDPPDFEIHFF